jgi:hypothetical protein
LLIERRCLQGHIQHQPKSFEAALTYEALQGLHIDRWSYKAIIDERLHFFDPNRVPFSYARITEATEWSRQMEVEPERLIVEATNIAINESLEFFKRFDWTPAREQLAEDQRRLLERRF